MTVKSSPNILQKFQEKIIFLCAEIDPSLFGFTHKRIGIKLPIRGSFCMVISYRNIVFTSILLIFVFFVFQVGASSQQIPHTAPPDNQQSIDSNDPIHIGKGFTTPLSTEKPQRIIIPRINIDISVVEAPIVDGHWEIAETFANHGMGSAYPGQKGNMVIFAHAREHLFLDLQYITSGDSIYVLTNNKWYEYTVSDITQVTPDQVEVIAPTGDERITLFTCSGFADEHRLIVVGKRVIKADFRLDASFMNLLE